MFLSLYNLKSRLKSRNLQVAKIEKTLHMSSLAWHTHLSSTCHRTKHSVKFALLFAIITEKTITKDFSQGIATKENAKHMMAHG